MSTSEDIGDVVVENTAATSRFVGKGINLVLSGSVVSLNLFVLLMLPFVASSTDWPIILAGVGVVSLSNLTHWALIHEAIHSKLHEHKPTNDRIGRLLSIMFGSPFHVLRFGHLAHHRYNRTAVDATDLVVNPGPHRFFHNAGYYFKILIGLYLGEIAVNLACLLPRRVLAWALRRFQADAAAYAEAQLLSRTSLMAMRIDAVLVLLMFSVSLYLYQGMIWAWCLLFLLRGVTTSFFDNIYHYGTPVDETEAAYNLAAPNWAERAILFSNLHELHHVQPHIPWTEKKAAFERAGGCYHKTMAQAAAEQFKGVIYVDGTESADT